MKKILKFFRRIFQKDDWTEEDEHAFLKDLFDTGQREKIRERLNFFLKK